MQSIRNVNQSVTSESIIGKSLANLDGSSKKPKFLDKFNNLQKMQTGRPNKNTLDGFSPMSSQ